MGFTPEQLSAARTANLAEFLIENFPDDYRKVGWYVYRVNPDTNKIQTSMPLKWGFGGYYDFDGEDKGNAVDYLVRYHDYRFTDAVAELLQNSDYNGDDTTAEEQKRNWEVYNLGDDETQEVEDKNFRLPERYDKGFKHLFAHMIQTRCISERMVKWLIRKNLLYETSVSTIDKVYYNMVFVSADKSRIEIKETHSTQKYKRTKRRMPSDYWAFEIGKSNKIYLCESALDAVSLAELKCKDGVYESGIYASMSTCLNYNILNKLIQTGKQIYIAIDNDGAGEKVRNKLQGCGLDFIIPHNKDWTDDLIERRAGESEISH